MLVFQMLKEITMKEINLINTSKKRVILQFISLILNNSINNSRFCIVFK